MAGFVHNNVPFMIMIVTAATLLDNFSNTVSCRPDMTVKYFKCSPDFYDPNDKAYTASVTAALQDIIDHTADSGYDYYASSSAPEKAFAHGACNGKLSNSDCHACLCFTFPKIMNGCPFALGATLQFQDCRARYEYYPFVDQL